MRPVTFHPHGLAPQRGVSLIEIMIAMMVLAFGLIGLVGLQLSSMRSNQSSFERSTAVLLSYTIIDAMHAAAPMGFPDAVRDGEFNIDLDDASPGGGSFAQTQITNWRAQLQASLGPAATGSVACANTAEPNPIPCSITIRWDDSRGLQGSSTQTLTTEVQL